MYKFSTTSYFFYCLIKPDKSVSIVSRRHVRSCIKVLLILLYFLIFLFSFLGRYTESDALSNNNSRQFVPGTSVC